jgi:NADH-quinone oxidoreductase subunit L
MRKMGGLRKAMPITSTAMGLGVLSIAGVPFFSGFWSKDEILEAVHHNWEAEGIFGALWWLGLLTAAMTAFYMTRLWMMTFSGPPFHEVEEVIPSDDHSDSGNWKVLKKEVKIQAHEAPWVMTIPLMILAFLAVFSGFIIFLGEGFGSVVFYGTPPSSEGPIQWGLLDHILLSPLTYLSVLVGLTGVILGYLFYKRGDDGQTPFSTAFVSDNIVTSNLHTFLSNRMYMARLFDWFGMRTWDTLAMACDWFDRNIIDGIVNGVASITQIFSGQVRKLTSGFTGHYASLTIGGLGALVVITKVVFPLMGWSL